MVAPNSPSGSPTAPQPMSIVVAGGGTAGHIEPALAVADACRQAVPTARITALGTAKGLEKDLVPARGYMLKLIDPVPVPRKPSADLARLPLRVWKAVRQARAILQDVNADVLIGFGGYVSAPAYVAAKTLGIPFYVHESNASAGMANKLGVKLGGVGLNAVPQSGMKGEVVGVPIRDTFRPEDQEFLAEQARKRWDLDPHRTTIVVTGGSQGAQSINRAVEQAAAEITALGCQIVHAVGKKNLLPAPREHYHPVAYIEQMAEALAAADVVVCRAGAMTVAEVTSSGTPAVYVPLPHGNGEQSLNALPVVNTGGARMIADSELSPAVLVDTLQSMVSSPDTMRAMAAATRSSAAGNAAEEIARRLITAATERRVQQQHSAAEGK